MTIRLSVVIVEEDRARAIAIVDALKDAHDCDAIVIDNSSGLARRTSC
jgi:response regulator NasT